MQGDDYNDSYYYDNYTLPLATSWVQLFACGSQRLRPTACAFVTPCSKMGVPGNPKCESAGDFQAFIYVQGKSVRLPPGDARFSGAA